MSRPNWRMVEVIDRPGRVPREQELKPAAFFRQALDQVLPRDAVVLRAGSGFALDLVESGRREPFVVEPLPWHQFVEVLGPVAR